jgi:hypothetical protein
VKDGRKEIFGLSEVVWLMEGATRATTPSFLLRFTA